ncbi:MAG TPA: hypothetical protein VJP02_20660 [Candidatus Sulfotelmatobacter sp.]|nr:hypothetical protein [Candidatus Sulfotelmatobacter sp.]
MSDVHRTIEAVWKIESTRLITAIARVTRDIGIAEELARDALVAAIPVVANEPRLRPCDTAHTYCHLAS